MAASKWYFLFTKKPACGTIQSIALLQLVDGRLRAKGHSKRFFKICHAKKWKFHVYVDENSQKTLFFCIQLCNKALFHGGEECTAHFCLFLHIFFPNFPILRIFLHIFPIFAHFPSFYTFFCAFLFFFPTPKEFKNQNFQTVKKIPFLLTILCQFCHFRPQKCGKLTFFVFS